ncbi:MAG: hypothetical protein LWX83_14605 [Anaerolineae bacterium]|nr:hypothetical protein [Anaerolineae bacterium]
MVGFVLVFLGSLSASPTSAVTLKGVEPIAVDFNYLLALVIIPVSFYLLGIKIAENAYKNKKLASVANVLVLQPVFGWQAFENQETETQPMEIIKRASFFKHKSVSHVRDDSSGIFSFNFEKDELYIIAMFSRTSLFFRKIDDEKGTPYIISNELIASIELFAHDVIIKD